jgi:hypothetical protein
MLGRDDLSVWRVEGSGAWEISAMVHGYRVSRVFYGYSKREAIRIYLREVDTW